MIFRRTCNALNHKHDSRIFNDRELLEVVEALANDLRGLRTSDSWHVTRAANRTGMELSSRSLEVEYTAGGETAAEVMSVMMKAVQLYTRLTHGLPIEDVPSSFLGGDPLRTALALATSMIRPLSFNRFKALLELQFEDFLVAVAMIIEGADVTSLLAV